MKLRGFYLFLYLMGSAFPAVLPAQDLKKADKKLAAMLVNMHESTEAWEKYPGLDSAFEADLLNTLRLPGAANYSFDYLTREMAIDSSKDARVRTFSWIGFLGGTWHDRRSILTFTPHSGKQTQVRTLHHPDCAMTGSYTDATIYFIQQLPVKEGTCYLLTGWGTHGSGEHHEIARVFYQSGDTLTECRTCFPEDTLWVVATQRAFRPNITFNETTQTLTWIQHSNRVSDNEWDAVRKYSLTWTGMKFDLLQDLGEAKPEDYR